MKHIFIINPKAGKSDRSSEFIAKIHVAFENKNIPYEIFLTEYKGHAIDIARRFAQTEEAVRLYAFGGDGTLNEVLSGAYGHSNVEIAVFPCGTGNDFVKVSNVADWTVEGIIEGQAKDIDIIKVNDRYCANITNVGFDAKVAYNVTKFKKLFGGHLAYYISVFFTLLSRINMRVKVFVEDKMVFNDKSLLCVAANGKVYGGGFNVAPGADISDGILNFVVVKKLSRLQITGFINPYKKGDHSDLINSGLMSTYTGRKMTIESDSNIVICADGEIFKSKKCEISIVPAAIKCVFPQNQETAQESLV
jgi:YegS/Rv2252/BmrU family lipid kinase